MIARHVFKALSQYQAIQDEKMEMVVERIEDVRNFLTLKMGCWKEPLFIDEEHKFIDDEPKYSLSINYNYEFEQLLLTRTR
jgi:hypothetical protein